jgi:hypothetical protein
MVPTENRRLDRAAAAVALALAFATAGYAQAPRPRVNSKTAAPTRFVGNFANVPKVDRPAESSDESRYTTVNIVVRSEWQLERERVLAMRQASRDAAKARREATWASLPAKYYTDEDFARSKFTVAHMLWQNGRVDSSRRFLEQLIADYPLTDIAERAKVVLARF